MPHNFLRYASLPALAIALSAAACTSVPTTSAAPPASAASGCGHLGEQIAAFEEARRAALEQQQGAWKAVVPFVVAGRYAGASLAVGDADAQLARLRAESSRQGCNHRGS